LAHSTVTSRKMTVSLQLRFNRVFARLQEDGLLLLSDSDLPNVSSLVVDEKIRGSWWSHKLAHTIFAVTEMLEDHPDVLIMKLISGKVTFVHRELWGRIYSIGVAREEWQMHELSANARALLEAMDEAGSRQTNKLGKEFGPKPADTARELESRLLIHAEQVHTESGAHAKVLETWDAWAKRVGFRARANNPVAARRFLDELLAALNRQHGGRGELPWPSKL
jgi:hypothetical protein